MNYLNLFIAIVALFVAISGYNYPYILRKIKRRTNPPSMYGWHTVKDSDEATPDHHKVKKPPNLMSSNSKQRNKTPIKKKMSREELYEFLIQMHYDTAKYFLEYSFWNEIKKSMHHIYRRIFSIDNR